MMRNNSPNDSTGPSSPQSHRIPRSVTTASRAELDPERTKLRVIEGKLPDDLYGHLFMAAALPHRDETPVLNGDETPVLNGNGTPILNGDGTPVPNGDGMIYRFDFDRAEVGLKTRIAKTPCYYADQAITRNGKYNKYKKYAFYNAGFTRLGLLGSRNQVNTAFLPVNERLLVTFDGGRPYEIDPKTLELLTPIGRNDEWIGILPRVLGLPFPTFFSVAHPCFDNHTGEMFTVNYSNLTSHLLPRPITWGIKQFIQDFGDFTDLIRWKGEGELERWRLELPDGSPIVIEQSLHQIGMTQDYIVLMDAGFRIEPEQIFSLFLINAIGRQIRVPPSVEAYVFSRFLPSRRQLPDTTLYIVRRPDPEQKGGSAREPARLQAQKVVIQREAAHFIVDYENPSDRITLHLAHSCAWDSTEWLHQGSKPAHPSVPIRKELQGMIAGPMDINLLGRHIIDGKSGEVLESQRVSDLKYTWSPSLYAECTDASGKIQNIYWSSWGFSWELLTKRIYESYKDYKYREIPLEKLPAEAQPMSLFQLDAASMQIVDGYTFPPGRFVSSPQFVPRRGSTDSSNDGYIVCVVLSDDESRPGVSKDEVWIFDANDLDREKPLCRLEFRSQPELPSLSFGLTLHTTWLPEIKPRTSSYHVPVNEDYAVLVNKQPQRVQELFEKEVYPHFKS